jgi:4-hydroxy-tetrahydrodipicolinate synthase
VNRPQLGGVIVPAITPVDSQERVDEQAFRRVLNRLIEAGASGLFVGGSAGEGPLLVAREWRRMVEIAREEVAGRVPLLGGAMDTSSRRIGERIEVLAECGYQWFVVAPSFYITLKTPSEHLRLLRECAQNARGMSMIAYNIPSCTGSVIPVEVFAQLAREGLISYCKESSGDMEYFRRLLSEGGPLGLKALMGDETRVLEGLQAGACGLVPVCANVEPETFLRAYQAALRQDWEEVASMQRRIEVLRKNLVLAGSNWIAGIKEALAVMGYCSGECLSPLEPLSRAQRTAVEAFVLAR